jgi:hypothetical protein
VTISAGVGYLSSSLSSNETFTLLVAELAEQSLVMVAWPESAPFANDVDNVRETVAIKKVLRHAPFSRGAGAAPIYF